MTEDTYLNVRNNEFQSNLLDTIKNITGSNNFADITLVCEDDQIEAHKLILSASSDFFGLVLTKNPHPHPLVYLKGVKVEVMKNLLTYMYMGEVTVEKQHLNTFMEAAEDLKINGLLQKSILSDLKLSDGNMFRKNSLIQKIIDHRVQKELKMNLEALENSKRSLIDHETEAKETMEQCFQKNFNEDLVPFKGNDDGNTMELNNEEDSYLNVGLHLRDHEVEAEIKDASIPSPPSLAKFENFNVTNFDTIDNSVSIERQFHDNLAENVATIKGNDDGPKEIELNQRINKEMETGELTDKFSNKEKIRKIKNILADFSTIKINGFYKCKICFKETKHSGHLKEHFEVHHIKTRRALFKCEFCGQPLKNSERLRKHAKTCSSNDLRPVWSDLLMVK